MASLNVEALGPIFSLLLAVLFSGTLFYLVRLHSRVAAMRGAQSELRGLLRACSDSVDGAEKAILSLRQSAQRLAGDLGRSMDEADRLREEIDRLCAGARQSIARLEVVEVTEPVAAPVAPRAKPYQPATPPAPQPVGSPKAAAGPHERAAMRLFRETIRGL